jgi:hypothetical protein
MSSIKQKTTKKNITKKNKNKCEDIYDDVKDYRQRFSDYWKNNSSFWKRNKKIIAPTGKHPVIYDYCKNCDEIEDLEEALSIYCGVSRIGKPEYNNIVKDYTDYINTVENINIAKFIKKIHVDYKYQNILQPKNWQMFILHFLLQTPEYLKTNDLKNPSNTKQYVWTQFLNLFDGRDKNDNTLIDVFTLGSGHDQDLEVRAQIIAERCEKKNIQNLITMDGHGRFLCSFLKEIFKKNTNHFVSNPLSIYICDIDEETINWHDYLFPLNVSVECDILSFIITSFILGKINSNDLFYLNFSGLEKQGETVEQIIDMFIKNGLQDNIILSFYTVRGAKDPSEIMISFLESKGFIKLTDRDDFVTMGTSTEKIVLYNENIIQYENTTKKNNNTNIFQTCIFDRWNNSSIEKVFEDGEKYKGYINNYDTKNKWFNIKYYDGDTEDLSFYQLFENGIVILPNTFEMNNTLNNRNKKRLRSRSKSIEEKTRSKSKKIKTTTTTKKNYKSKKFFV